MANESLNEIIQQLSDISVLIEEFSELAAEMKKSIDGSVSGLRKEKADIEDAVKSITSAAGKWENKFAAAEKDISDTSNKILSLSGSVNNINKLLDERVPQVKDISDLGSSIADRLEALTESVEKLTQTINNQSSNSNLSDRIEKIEKAVDILLKNDEIILNNFSVSSDKGETDEHRTD